MSKERVNNWPQAAIYIVEAVCLTALIMFCITHCHGCQ